MGLIHRKAHHNDDIEAGNPELEKKRREEEESGRTCFPTQYRTSY